MPVVAFPVNRLNQLLSKEYSQDELVKALEQLGCDVEDTAEMYIYECERCASAMEKLPHEDAPKRCDFCGLESEKPFHLASKDTVIRLDLLAARPDLFDTGGLARALRGFFGLQTGCPDYQTAAGVWELFADSMMLEAESYRPFIVGAVVTLPPLDSQGLRELMKLQENLHWGIGRDRKLTSIGVYDLKTLTPPFYYRAENPDTFSFVPLGMPGQRMTMRAILEQHPKGVAYAHLLKEHKKYPLLVDSKGVVLSMPPIINSEDTKVTLGASKFFIDVTGIARDPVNNTLNTLVSSLIEFGATVESVTVHDVWGKTVNTPDLQTRTIPVNITAASKWLGIPFDTPTFKKTLEHMRFTVTGEAPDFTAHYPAFRTDIKHEVDVFEDLAIGYGYDNLTASLVRSMTIGNRRPEEILTGKVRVAMLGLGYTENMSLVLASTERLFDKFAMEPGTDHVIIADAATRDQGVARPHLMLGLMEALRINRRRTPPLRLFETGNVLLLDDSVPSGVREERRLSFVVMSPEAGYAEVRAVLDAVLRELDLKGSYEATEHPSFIPGRCAQLVIDGKPVARLGEIHPQVINNFGLPLPVAMAELLLMRVI